MKSRLIYIGMAALFLSACSTGSYVASSYRDDIYFNPGDVPPPISAEGKLTDKPVDEKGKEKSGEKMIISQIEKNDDGSNTMNNYIFDGTKKDADALRYNMDQMELQNSDTTVYYNDDEMKYVINNYYDGDDLDFGYRILRFHDPFFYDPFYWDSWYYNPWYSWGGYYGSYYPGWSLGWNMGWYDPWYSWGYPYYSLGYPYYSWGYPYYGYGYYPSYAWGGYYGSYYNGYNYPYYGSINSANFRYGRRTTGTTDIDRNASRRSTSSVAASAVGRSVVKSGEIGARRTTQASTRVATSRTADQSESTPRVLTERRRSTSSNNIRSANDGNQNLTRSAQSYTRPGTSIQSRNYTRPSTSANNSSYNTPRVVTKSANGSNYSAPKTTSNYNRSYRTNSTYIRSSSSGSSSRTYRAPSQSSEIQRYSSPSRSSYSGGSSISRSSSSYSSGSSGSMGSSGSSVSRSSSGGSSRSGGGRR